MASIYDLSATAASNVSIDGTDVSGATGKIKDGDNVMRSLGAFSAQFIKDTGAVNTVAGTGDAITVTLSSSITAYATGQIFRFIAGAANTTAVTLNVNGIGIKAIRKISGGTDVALVSGDILAGDTYTLIYRATANAAAGGWVMIGVASLASYLTTATAASTYLPLTGKTLTDSLNYAVTQTIASATTTDIGAATSNSVIVSGVTTITGLGTVAAGVVRDVLFSGALTLTHSGTALILPGSANIVTAANDVATFRSLGSGNWVCLNYKRANGQVIANTTKLAAVEALANAAGALTNDGSGGFSYVVASSGQPIPSSSTFAVGTFLIAQNGSAGTITNGSTLAGSSLNQIGNTASGTLTWLGGALTGTWKNVSGVSLQNNGWGYWVRTV